MLPISDPNKQYCSTIAAQNFLDQLNPVFCSIDDYIQQTQQLHQRCTDCDDSNWMDCDDWNEEENKAHANSGLTSQYVELCSFCDDYYCTLDELSEYVAFFLHRETCSVSAQFVAKEQLPASGPMLLSPNIANNICYFCYCQLKDYHLPLVLQSFGLKTRDLDDCLVNTCATIFPLEIVQLMIEYTNPAIGVTISQ